MPCRREIAIDNDDPATEVHMACATRWLSRDKAAQSVIEKYESVTEQHYDSQDSNTTSLGLSVHVTLVVLLAICVVRFVLCCAILCCVVRFCGLHTAAVQFTLFALVPSCPSARRRYRTDYKYFVGLCAVSDVMAKQAVLSRAFQPGDLDGHTVRAAVAAFLEGMGRLKSKHFGPSLEKLREGMGPGYSAAEPGNFVYGNKKFEISFSVAKRQFIEDFSVELATSAEARIKERFPSCALLEAFDVFDVRRLPDDVPDDYGSAEIELLRKHFVSLVQVDDDDTAAEWPELLALLKVRQGHRSRYYSHLHRFVCRAQARPKGEPWRLTYKALKRELGARLPIMQAHMDIKAVLVLPASYARGGFLI